MSYFKSFKLPLTIIRPFNNFGPRQSNRAVIPTIINQVLKKNCKEINIGSTKPKRDFLYVDDTVSAYLKIINNTKLYGEVYNVGTGVEISIKDLIYKILKITNKKNIRIKNEKIRNRPKDSEVMRLVCNASKIEKKLKWKSSIKSKKDFDNILKKTIEWYEKNTKKIKNKKNFYI